MGYVLYIMAPRPDQGPMSVIDGVDVKTTNNTYKNVDVETCQGGIIVLNGEGGIEVPNEDVVLIGDIDD